MNDLKKWLIAQLREELSDSARAEATAAAICEDSDTMVKLAFELGRRWEFVWALTARGIGNCLERIADRGWAKSHRRRAR